MSFVKIEKEKEAKPMIDPWVMSGLEEVSNFNFFTRS